MAANAQRRPSALSTFDGGVPSRREGATGGGAEPLSFSAVAAAANGAEFLSDECGRNALKLAARGSTIIAELLRLAEHIPIAFTNPQRTEYSNLIFDFAYFRQREIIDQVIADSPELSRLDEEFWQTHMELLDRFFRLFRAVFTFVTQLNRFVDEIDQGLYVAQSLDGIVNGSLNGVQLLCELHHMYGVMLLLLDEKIGGKTREHLMVSYIRYRGAGEPHAVDVTRLCRSTGYEPATPPAADVVIMSGDRTATDATQGPPSAWATAARVQGTGRGRTDAGYPAAYFARVPVHGELVRKLINRLRSEDIYRMSLTYPLPEHRGVAMAMQGALLYTLLFFQPSILAEEGPVMREIVSKHFYDNWVISYYLGFTVDLTVAWECFPAAKAAISRTAATESVTYYQKQVRAAVLRCEADLGEVLQDGTLTEPYVLDNIFCKLLPLLRDANASLRWLILHGTRGQRPGQRYAPSLAPSYEAVRAGITDDIIITVLLKTAQLEFELRGMFTALLQGKKRKWRATRRAAAAKLRKLSDYFAGKDVLTRDQADPQLCEWFAEVAGRIEGLEYHRHNEKQGRDGSGAALSPLEKGDPAAAARRKLQKLIKALENVQEFRQVSTSLQVVQHVQETHELLAKMIRYVNVEREVLATIATVGDFSYAWEQLSVHGFFVKEIQEGIKAKPALSGQMQSVFVKLASLVTLPCRRIEQACFLSAHGSASAAADAAHAKPRRTKSTHARGGARDASAGGDPRLAAALEATAAYYSNSIAGFARRVLHVIPTAIFETLRKVMQLLIVDEVFKECPSKIARQDMKAMSQLPVRERLSAYTADIARYASGILAMKSMRVGVAEMDSHQLLEDGVRRELVDQVARELHAGIQFDKKNPMTPAELEGELHRLGQRLGGIRASFEYIQDYINVHGLRIWLEEFARIVNFNADMEANAFISRKVYPWNSRHQSESTPIPYFDKRDPTASVLDAGSADAKAGGGPSRGHVHVNGSAARPSQKQPQQPQQQQQLSAPVAVMDSKTAYGFLGHLVQHLLLLTDPITSTYLSSVGSWYSRTTLTEVVGLRTFSSIGAALGPAGLRALDRLLCFIVAKDVQIALNAMRRAVNAPAAVAPAQSPKTAATEAAPTVMEALHRVTATLCSSDVSPAARKECLAAYARLDDLLSPSLSSVTETLVRVGRLQLMRKMLSNELRSSGKLSSGCLYTALRTANDALLAELTRPFFLLSPQVEFEAKLHTARHREWRDAAVAEEAASVASLFAASAELAPYLDAVGISDVLHQVFAVPSQQPPIPFLVLYLVGLLLRAADRVFYDDRFSACTPARVGDRIDPSSLLAGLALLLRQFHASVADSLVTCLSQALRTSMCVFSEEPLAPATERGPNAAVQTAPSRLPELEVMPIRVETLAHLLQLLFFFLGRPQEELQDVVPATLFGDVRFHASATRAKPRSITHMWTAPPAPCGSAGFVSAAASLSQAEIERFSRQIMVEGIGAQGMARIRQGMVCCVGAGGLGSTVALYLAAAGVGKLVLVDFDDVELSNLHRQIIHTTASVGQKKVDRARAACLAIYPEANVEAIPVALTVANAETIFGDADIVVDGSDNVAARYLINDAAMRMGRPLVSGSAMRWEGQLTVYGFAGGPCYRCLFPQPPPAVAVGSCNDSGVIGPVPGMIGCLQALEVLKILAQAGEPLSGRMLLFDGLRLSMRVVKLRPRQAERCPACGEDGSKTQRDEQRRPCLAELATSRPEYVTADGCGGGPAASLPESARCSPKEFALQCLAFHKGGSDCALPLSQLGCSREGDARSRAWPLCVDVRVHNQFDMCHLPHSHSLPLPEMQSWERRGTLLANWRAFLLAIAPKDTPSWAECDMIRVYMLCRRGIASAQATQLLLSHAADGVLTLDLGSGRSISVTVVNVDGGLNAYHREVDSRFPFY